MSAWFSRL
jgi:hypothetical protein